MTAQWLPLSKFSNTCNGNDTVREKKDLRLFDDNGLKKNAFRKSVCQ